LQSGGRLRRPLNVPIEVFSDEIEFYELGSRAIDKFREDEGYTAPDSGTSSGGTEQPAPGEPPLPTGRIHRAVWLLFEYPESSKAARVVAVISVSVILLSIIAFCLETLPQFKRYRVIRTYVDWPNVTTGRPSERQSLDPDNDEMAAVVQYSVTSSVFASSMFEEDDIPTVDEPFFVIETICVIWFTSEVAVRFAASPDHLAFFRSLMNLIDVVAIAPYFITLSTMFADQPPIDGGPVIPVASNQV